MTRQLIYFICLTLLGCSQSHRTIEFEKIIFHSSSCFGTCPTFHLQLDKDETFKLYAEEVYKKDGTLFTSDFDTSKTGYFIGKAADTSFTKLLIELNNIGLDTINFDGPMYTDGPEITLIVYYNGKRQFFRSSYPTPKATRLINTLYEICETSSMTKSDQTFIIESGKASR